MHGLTLGKVRSFAPSYSLYYWTALYWIFDEDIQEYDFEENDGVICSQLLSLLPGKMHQDGDWDVG